MTRVSGEGISRMTRRTQAVESAVRVLDLFTLSSPELSLKQICDQLHANASTVHRLLKAMEETSLVVRVAGTDLYRLGPKLMTLGTGLCRVGVSAVGAAILNSAGRPVAGMAVVGLASDPGMQDLECVGKRVCQVAGEVTRLLGYPTNGVTS